jgi:hypothetical protein
MPKPLTKIFTNESFFFTIDVYIEAKIDARINDSGKNTIAFSLMQTPRIIPIKIKPP